MTTRRVFISTPLPGALASNVTPARKN
jgi:hypothetical protein